MCTAAGQSHIRVWKGAPTVEGLGPVGEPDNGFEESVALVMGCRWRVRIKKMVLRREIEMNICISSWKDHNSRSARLASGRGLCFE